MGQAPTVRAERREAAVVLVIGVDAGGTGTRVVLAEPQAAGGAAPVVRGTASGPAGNATSVPPEVLADRLVTCLTQCLAAAGASPAEVGAVAAGLAGLRSAPSAAGTVLAAVERAGMTCPVRVCSDVDVAFAAGSDRPDGVVLIAGTGAAGARVRGFEAVATSDGTGWLLGDDGGGFWIARQAVRAALAALDGRGPQTSLLPSVCTELRAPQEVSALVAAAMAVPPPGLAALAPLVFAAVEDPAGDPVADAIVRDAVRHLVDTALALRPRPDEPLVLAGGLLGPVGPLRKPVTGELLARGLTEVNAVGDGVLGAVALAELTLAENKF